MNVNIPNIDWDWWNKTYPSQTGTTVTYLPSVEPKADIEIDKVENGFIISKNGKEYVATTFEQLTELLKQLLEVK